MKVGISSLSLESHGPHLIMTRSQVIISTHTTHTHAHISCENHSGAICLGLLFTFSRGHQVLSTPGF